MARPLVELGSSALEGAARDGAGSFEADLERCHAELLRYLRTRLQDRDAAADLVQEASLRALRYRDQLTGDALRSMLYRIANNLLADHWRRAQVRGGDDWVDIDTEPIADTQPQPDEALVQAQRMVLLKRAVMALPPKRRQVLVMVRLQGLCHAEAARRLGITVSAVEKHLARAIAACGDHVGSYDL